MFCDPERILEGIGNRQNRNPRPKMERAGKEDATMALFSALGGGDCLGDIVGKRAKGLKMKKWLLPPNSAQTPEAFFTLSLRASTIRRR